jgi:hypothetical protein
LVLLKVEVEEVFQQVEVEALIKEGELVLN